MRINPLILAGCIFLVVPVCSMAQQGPVYSGVEHLVASAGNMSRFCNEDNHTLRLRFGNGIISSTSGNCQGPVSLSGAFDDQCSYGGRVLHFSGTATASSISLHTEHVFPDTTCEYNVRLIPEQ